MKKGICLALLVFLMTSCANMSDGQRTTAEGAGLGVAGGAALGALVGQVFGKDTKSTLIGAAIGGALGGLLGGVYGNHVAHKKARYANEEDYLNACIDSARSVQQETCSYNEALKKEIVGLDAEVEQLVAKYNRKQIQKTALLGEKKKVDTTLAETEKKLQRAKDEVTIQKEVLAKEKNQSKDKLAELEGEIKNLEGTIAELEGQTKALASINQKFSV